MTISAAFAMFGIYMVLHWFRHMLNKALSPPFNVHRQQAVVELVSSRDDNEEELNYFCDLHKMAMGGRRAQASQSI